MSLHIYNSLTRKKEEFLPLNPPEVNIYTCGVTVYDECHIGHARSLYIFDLIRRYLEYRGYKVNLVRNITDIDDKIIKRANELKIPWDGLVAKYIESYYRDLEALGLRKGILDGAEEPRATKNIAEIITLIQGLLDKGYAYAADTGVYFAVRKFSPYGKLSGQGIEQMRTGARKEADETKRDPLDFALWKKSKPGEPFWPSPWGEGRPGWHIECSAMSLKYFKVQTLDIHAGGRDLIFPHHENEIAQSEAWTGKTFARYWIHHGLLTINGQKMSKSLGNFVTVKDFLKKEYPVDVLKLFFLQTHYSQPIDFSWDKMDEKRKALSTFIIFARRVKQKEEGKESPVKAVLKIVPSTKELYSEIERAKMHFEKAMDDDFNTPIALACLFEIVRSCNKVLYDISYTDEYLPVLIYAKQMIQKFGNMFGLSFEETPLTIPMEDIEYFIKMRENCKKQKLYNESDRIRKELEEKGIILEDTKEGTIWRRKV